MSPLTLPSADNSILLLLDIQEKLAAAMPAQYLQGNITRMSKLAIAARKLGVPTVATRQYPQGLGPILPVIAAELDKDQPSIEKNEFNCLRNTEFTAYFENLKDHQHIVIAGLESHTTILQSAIACRESKSVWVVSDACLSRHKEDHIAAMSLLLANGVQVTTFEALLYIWAEAAATPYFKEVSYLSRDRDD